MAASESDPFRNPDQFSSPFTNNSAFYEQTKVELQDDGQIQIGKTAAYLDINLDDIHYQLLRALEVLDPGHPARQWIETAEAEIYRNLR